MSLLGPEDDPEAISVIVEPAVAQVAPSAAAMTETTAVVSLGTYTRAYISRIKSGDSGVLPVVGGLILISIIFEILNSKFLTPENMMNWLQQSSGYMVMAMGIVFVLLMGEIDLSVGWVGLLGGAVAGELLAHNSNLVFAILACLATTSAIGFIQGLLITRLGLPSFVVTLAGLLVWEGVLLYVLGAAGTVPMNDSLYTAIFTGHMTNLTAGWVVIGVLVFIFALVIWRRDDRRRASGLVAPPQSLTTIKIGAIAVVGVALALLVNANRGVLAAAPIRGLPWYVLEVMGIVLLWSLLLNRTRPGRYIYAIGGNKEAARRAGVSTQWIRTLGFTLCSLNGGVAGLLFASQLGGVSSSTDGGQLVLYSIAAAVIGGTSLFGGRGKAIHGVIGGLVIAGVVNGMALIGVQPALQFVMTGVVLTVAVTIDAVSHRKSTATV